MVTSRLARFSLIAFGGVCVGIGVVAVVVPGLPTTVFMIVAAWAFSKSSPRFQRWVTEHERFGPAVVAWREHGAIPAKAKILAVIAMTASLAAIVLFGAQNWILPTVVGAVMGGIGIWILTRPSV
ncbi:MAG: YbaN family protein [Rhodospirillaceae bacterium]